MCWSVINAYMHQENELFNLLFYILFPGVCPYTPCCMTPKCNQYKTETTNLDDGYRIQGTRRRVSRLSTRVRPCHLGVYDTRRGARYHSSKGVYIPLETRSPLYLDGTHIPDFLISASGQKRSLNVPSKFSNILALL